jgi:tRNA threonylcarbamoyl adenosine modification protein (Sua5/YciO/YrdC/YwlC family)
VEPVRLRLGDLPEDEMARRAAFVLRKGGIALLPAEGVYGFHVSSAAPGALERLRAFKRRETREGWIGLIARPEDAGRWARLDAPARRLAREHWPGALTLVLDALPAAPAALLSAEGTIALRCPGTAFLRAVAGALDRAGPASGALVLSTSANEPGMTPALRVDEAPAGIADLAVDGGPLTGVPSTVVRTDASGLRVLRQGAISLGDHGLDAPRTPPLD